MSLQHQLHDLLLPSIEALGFELWGIEFHANSKQSVLRIFIDHVDGIDIEDCVTVSHQITGVLDVHDPIKVPYTLEVSSPGADRLLFNVEQFTRYVGSVIKLQLNTKVMDRRRLEVQLCEVVSEGLMVVLNTPKKMRKTKKVQVEVEQPSVLVRFEWIDRANLVPVFDN